MLECERGGVARASVMGVEGWRRAVRRAAAPGEAMMVRGDITAPTVFLKRQ
ncbi:MAG: hypothetical protein ACOC0V_03825 [Oceanicaulis sp.]